MVALGTLVDEPLLIRDPIAHPVLEVCVAEVPHQELAPLEGPLAQRAVLSHTPHLKLVQYGRVEAVWPANLLIEHLDGHLMRNAPVADEGHLIRRLVATHGTGKRRCLGQFTSKSLNKVFVRGMSAQDLGIVERGCAALNWTGELNLFLLDLLLMDWRSAWTHIVFYP
jgi:hypothetical protein